MTAVRARFAPSPTGALHVGSARTALLNWLFVRAYDGRLLLRIDDTDASRGSRELEDAILDDLRWLGLDWDDGPVRQSDRLARYAEVLAELPVSRRDDAYVFEDRVIARADGSPLYHLATAVDDVDDAISHVLRGRDHLSNTDLQVAIIRAMGVEPPVYVHAPLLVFEDGAKVSKREGDSLTVAALREAGYPAAAVCNALALSLTDFGTEELMFSLPEIAARFELDKLHSADSHFDPDKLRWISGQHIRAMDAAAFAAELAERGAGALPSAAVAAAQTGGATFVECAAVAHALVEPPEPDIAALDLIRSEVAGSAMAVFEVVIPEVPVALESAKQRFDELKSALKAEGLKLGEALHALRALLTGRTEGVEFHLLLATLTPAIVEKARAELNR